MLRGQAALLHAALPQTQCRRCGYADCAAYAQALADGQAAINRCPPGGIEGVARLAALTGQAPQDLDPACGQAGARHEAVIDEPWCIGCTLCIKACPTDAIVGASKRMHTVIAPWCTGCGLCVPACPVDCIQLQNVSGALTGWQAWSHAQAEAALERYTIHSNRRPYDADSSHKTLKNMAPTPSQHAATAVTPSLDGPSKRALVEAAKARALARRHALPPAQPDPGP